SLTVGGARTLVRSKFRSSGAPACFSCPAFPFGRCCGLKSALRDRLQTNSKIAVTPQKVFNQSMNVEPDLTASSSKRGRLGFAFFHLLSLLLAWLLLRLVLFFSFGPRPVRVSDVVLAFLSGLQRDLLVALVSTFPFVLWF